MVLVTLADIRLPPPDLGSHPNDEDAHFRLSEQQIFTAIFTYVDHLFSKIKPKKLFFMAVDGVAPRAKMNQQRSRRFRTAQEAKETREKAEKRGEVLPSEKAFDSNCITPGELSRIQTGSVLRGDLCRFLRYSIYGEVVGATQVFREQEDYRRRQLGWRRGYSVRT